MAEIITTVAQMKNTADQLRTLNQRFKGAVSHLVEVEGALNGMWEGEARTAFHNAFSSDKIQMDNFYNAIEVYVARLEAAAARYEQTEATNTGIAVQRG